MDARVPGIRARMPLAEASLLVWRYIADPTYLDALFDQHRGRHYTKVLSFPQMVQLIADVLLCHEGSGRRGFETAQQTGQLLTSVQAVYAKLRRLPIEVSTAFLSGCTDRLRELYPQGVGSPQPESLGDFQVIVLDGKTVKWVQKRLEPVRKATGGVLGGKALVALGLNTGLALGMQAHPDGDANEVRFVSDLLGPLRARCPGRRLWLADRAFGYPTILEQFGAEQDAFVVRARGVVTFEPDPRPAGPTGRDAQGRLIRQAWGWLGRAHGSHRVPVRRLTLERPGESPLVLLTSLVDAEAYPAEDLLALYAMRWGIERVFQQVTKVFGLKRLIGHSPAATIFQLAFCLLMYNVTLVTKAYIAAGQQRPLESISTEKFFDDIRKHLVAWNLLYRPEETAGYLEPFDSGAAVRSRLHRLLHRQWSEVWRKSPSSKRSPPPSRRGRTHCSVYRLLQADKARKTITGTTARAR